mgnify:FL=1|jgi:hypothetical protein
MTIVYDEHGCTIKRYDTPCTATKVYEVRCTRLAGHGILGHVTDYDEAKRRTEKHARSHERRDE